jgi:hypothetical protein
VFEYMYCITGIGVWARLRLHTAEETFGNWVFRRHVTQGAVVGMWRTYCLVYIRSISKRVYSNVLICTIVLRSTDRPHKPPIRSIDFLLAPFIDYH